MRSRLHLSAKTFFLFGYSAGGIGVQGFAENFPALCAGAVIVNGRDFIEKRGATCPFLITHTYGDGGQKAGDGLAAYCDIIGAPHVRLLVNPSWGLLHDGEQFSFHAVHPTIPRMSLSFLSAIADGRRNQHREDVDYAAMCPYVVNLLNPREVYASNQHEIAHLIQKNGGQPAAIPSAMFYADLVSLPPPTRLSEDEKQGTSLYAVPRIDHKPTGVVAEWWPSQEYHASPAAAAAAGSRVNCDIRYFTERDWIGVSAYKTISALHGAYAHMLLELPGAASLPTQAIAFDPWEDDLRALITLPHLQAVNVVVSSVTMLTPLFPVLRLPALQHTRIRVVICVADKGAFDAEVAAHRVEAQRMSFTPFLWPDHHEQSMDDAAVHQRLIEKVVDAAAIDAP